MKHRKVVPRSEDDIKALADSVGDLDYEQLADFLEHIRVDVQRRALKSTQAKQHELGFQLSLIHNQLLNINLLFDEVIRKHNEEVHTV